MSTEEVFERRKQRLAELVERYGSAVNLGRALGHSSGATVGQWLSGHRRLREDSVAKIEDLPGLSGWFSRPASGSFDSAQDFSDIPSDNAADHSENVIPSAHSLQNEISDVVIRQFETGGSMGRGIVLAEQPGVIKEWRVSDRWAQENVHRITSVKNLAIVTGFGPSMQPLFNPGDPLLVDRGINRADVDGIYFFRVGEEGFVKQLQRIPTANGLILRAKSYNTLYDPFDITHGMDFEVFARVVKVWKGEEF